MKRTIEEGRKQGTFENGKNKEEGREGRKWPLELNTVIFSFIYLNDVLVFYIQVKMRDRHLSC